LLKGGQLSAAFLAFGRQLRRFGLAGGESAGSVGRQTDPSAMSEFLNWSLSWPLALSALTFGYVLGSIPFGLIITKAAGTQDIRSIGSGNIGATNVLRTGRKGLAAATLLGDALKGTAAVLIAANWGLQASLIAGLGAFLGHLFPVWLGFRGGKGVATFLGVLLGLWWKAALLFAAIWIAVAYLSRYSSLASLLASLAVPAALYASGMPREALVFAAMTVLLFAMHRTNIARLIAGTEGKIGQKG
jgi:acyl phosphate:glycerol-3-phosphate acyltransferase